MRRHRHKNPRRVRGLFRAVAAALCLFAAPPAFADLAITANGSPGPIQVETGETVTFEVTDSPPDCNGGDVFLWRYRWLVDGNNRDTNLSLNSPCDGPPRSRTTTFTSTGNRTIRFEAASQDCFLFCGFSNYDSVEIQVEVTDPNAGPNVDHYAVIDPGDGVTCEALEVEIEARNPMGTPVQPPAGTTIDVFATQPGTSNPASDSSWASSPGSYQTSATFGGGTDSVTLDLRRTSAGAVNVDVDDGSATESPSADPDIDFRETGFLFYADGTAGAIGGQIADKRSDRAPGDQDLSLRAVVDPNGSAPGAACQGRLADDQQIEMAFECRDPTNCSASRNVVIDSSATGSFNGTTIAGNALGPVTSWSNVTLDFGTDGRAPFRLNYPDAGAIRLHARETVSADAEQPAITLTGESNEFVVRPFGFHVSVPDNPGATEPGDNGVHRAAGADFPVEVTAVGWAPGDDAPPRDGDPDGHADDDPANNVSLAPAGDNVALPNFGGADDDETVTLEAELWKPDPGNDEDLAGATSIGDAAFDSPGDVQAGAGSTTVNYPEVGIIELRARLDSGGYQGSADVLGSSGPVGRFTPHDFRVGLRNAGMYAATCTGGSAAFSYVGQDFGYAVRPELEITARNVGEEATENYRDGFIHLTPGDIDLDRADTDASAQGNVSGAEDIAVNPATGSDEPAQLVDFVSGPDGDAADNGVLVYTLPKDDRYRYDKVHNARIGEFTAALPIAVDDVTDGDGVT